MTSETRSTRAAEFLGLTSFAMGLMLLISLATYSPRDPAPFFKAGANGAAQNFIGPFGAFLAELLVPQLFGVAALLLPLVLGVAGWKLFWCRPIEAPYTKAAGLMQLLLSTTAFLSLTFGTVSLEGEPIRAGGATGELLAGLLTVYFNRTGAYIVVATSLFVALILTTQFSFAAFISGAWRLVAGRVRVARTAWAHFLENRRKERMRREVIRKHAQSKDGPSEGMPRVRRVKAQQPEGDEAEDLPLGVPEVQADAAKAPPRQKPLPFVATPEPEAEPEEP